MWTLLLVAGVAWSGEPADAPTLLETFSADRQDERDEALARWKEGPPPEPVPISATALPDDPEDVIIVEVVSRGEIARARQAIVGAFEDLGWRAKVKRDGRIVLRGAKPWMGKAFLRPSGDLDFTRNLLVLAPDGEAFEQFEPDSMQLHGEKPPEGLQVMFRAPGARPVRALQDVLRARIGPLLGDYRRKLFHQGLAAKLDALPGDLDALWTDGMPLEHGPRLDTPVARRAAVLEHWATRAPTAEGRTVCAAIEAWLRNTVQDSEHPVTLEEARRAEARREDGRRLDIF